MIDSTRRGYILVALSLALVFLLGISGLAIDVGRMYITKSEAQSFADSAAFAAALELDSTAAGITRAQTAVSNNPKKWEFQNDDFTGVQTAFATAAAGPWTTAPPNPPTGYYFARVQTTVNLPMYLMGPLSGRTATIAAAAVAGRAATSGTAGGEFPFSPYTRAASPDNASDPFGYQVGNDYTLRWGAPGDRTTCGTDASQPNLSSNGKIRGYCCVSQSAADLRQAIVGGQTDPVNIGDPVPMDNGAKNTEMSAIAMRVEEDTDTTSTTYAQYLSNGTGNGERVVMVAVNNGAPSYTNVGFAGFFLLNDSAYTGLKGNDSACGEYIGTFVQGAAGQGGSGLAPGGSGAYHIKLYQ
ncbi:MAG: Tad domain-containing protein [Acidobacteriia bacterium]|nr:Tad domain-containing protein [Terriglobia bacterium]